MWPVNAYTLNTFSCCTTYKDIVQCDLYNSALIFDKTFEFLITLKKL